MKAAVRTRYGPPDVVRISEVHQPAPGDKELLVKVRATTVNRTDCHYRSGRPWLMRPLLSGVTRTRVSILGNEFAGQVVAAGSGVTTFQIGDRVFGYTEGPFGAPAGSDRGGLQVRRDRAEDRQRRDHCRLAPVTEGDGEHV